MFIVKFAEFILAGNATSAECVASALEWSGHRLSLTGCGAFRRWNPVQNGGQGGGRQGQGQLYPGTGIPTAL